MNTQNIEEQYNTINYKYKNVLTEKILKKVHNLPIEEEDEKEIVFDKDRKIYHKKYLRYKGKLDTNNQNTSG